MSGFWIFAFLVCFQSVSMRSIEPQCSPYDFFERTIEKVLRVEQSNELLKKDLEKEMAQFRKLRESTLLALEEFKSKAEGILETQSKQFEESTFTFDKKLENLKGLEEKVTKNLRESLEDVKSHVEGTLERQNKQIEESTSAVKNKLDSLKNGLKTPAITFQAKEPTVSHLSSGDTIKFPSVVLNEGDGYDSSTGVFTVPVNGTYLFSVQVCLNVDRWLHINVVAADTIIAASYYIYHYDAVCHTSNGVAVLSHGDKVKVTVGYSKSSGNVIYPDNNNNHCWTSFSGVLIHK